MSESKSDKNYWAGEEGFKEVLDQEHARIAERTKRTSAGVWAGVSLSRRRNPFRFLLFRSVTSTRKVWGALPP